MTRPHPTSFHPAVTLPVAAGLGLRTPHLTHVLETRPDVAWFEVHSENYFLAGGAQWQALAAIREHYPISVHGVGMSLGSAEGLNPRHIEQLKTLIDRIQPAAVSEHLCWSAVGGRWLNDLLPLPYTQEALNLVCRHIDQLQTALRRPIVLENVSSYLRFLPEDMPEWVFLNEVAERTGCGVLLDVNNIYVSACNHGFDAHDFLAGIAPRHVAEIHLAGFEIQAGLLVDTHSRPVCAEVWALYQAALARFGAVPTLIEWDQDIPEFSVLQAEAARAEHYLQHVRQEQKHAQPA